MALGSFGGGFADAFNATYGTMARVKAEQADLKIRQDQASREKTLFDEDQKTKQALKDGPQVGDVAGGGVVKTGSDVAGRQFQSVQDAQDWLKNWLKTGDTTTIAPSTVQPPALQAMPTPQAPTPAVVQQPTDQGADMVAPPKPQALPVAPQAPAVPAVVQQPDVADQWVPFKDPVTGQINFAKKGTERTVTPTDVAIRASAIYSANGDPEKATNILNQAYDLEAKQSDRTKRKVLDALSATVGTNPTLDSLNRFAQGSLSASLPGAAQVNFTQTPDGKITMNGGVDSVPGGGHPMMQFDNVAAAAGYLSSSIKGDWNSWLQQSIQNQAQLQTMAIAKQREAREQQLQPGAVALQQAQIGQAKAQTGYLTSEAAQGPVKSALLRAQTDYYTSRGKALAATADDPDFNHTQKQVGVDPATGDPIIKDYRAPKKGGGAKTVQSSLYGDAYVLPLYDNPAKAAAMANTAKGMGLKVVVGTNGIPVYTDGKNVSDNPDDFRKK